MWFRSGRPAFPLAVVTLALTLAACQVRPLYAPAAMGGGPSVQAALPGIRVAEATTRPEQVFRNDLLFAFRGGGEGAPARYHMTYRLSIQERPLAIARITGTPSTYQLYANASFLIEDLGTGKTLLADHVTAQTSYDRSSQDFANVRAEKEAEERVALTLANLVEARIATFFATH